MWQHIVASVRITAMNQNVSFIRLDITLKWLSVDVSIEKLPWLLLCDESSGDVTVKVDRDSHVTVICESLAKSFCPLHCDASPDERKMKSRVDNEVTDIWRLYREVTISAALSHVTIWLSHFDVVWGLGAKQLSWPFNNEVSKLRLHESYKVTSL